VRGGINLEATSWKRKGRKERETEGPREATASRSVRGRWEAEQR